MSILPRTTLRALPSRRLLSTSSYLSARSSFNTGPAPPRLPEEDQKLFEQLQKASTGAFSTPKPSVVVNKSLSSSSSRPRPQINQSPQSAGEVKANDQDTAELNPKTELNARIQAKGDGGELHPDIRRGAKPEFEGDRNPKTGEIGGPKNEPLRWGGEVDWSYNGRVTDF